MVKPNRKTVMGIMSRCLYLQNAYFGFVDMFHKSKVFPFTKRETSIMYVVLNVCICCLNQVLRLLEVLRHHISIKLHCINYLILLNLQIVSFFMLHTLNRSI